MKVLVTGALGLVGSEAVRYYLERGHEVVGVDNNMRRVFFGPGGCVLKNKVEDKMYRHLDIDIDEIETAFIEVKPDFVIHAAAQPSHDWAVKNPMLDYQVNAIGTLKLLEACRKYARDAVIVYLSTNKVYGDAPNRLPLIECEKRYERHGHGIDESMSVDQCLHSLFGVSKLSGDLLMQEYARYFGMKIGIFRCGCITGAHHSGVELHGFLSYLVRCHKEKKKYRIYGYKGKQVRDNIHAYDLVTAIDAFAQNPRSGEVYNMGGGRNANISVLEAVDLLNLDHEYIDTPRVGDHIWYVSDVTKFRSHYPEWEYTYGMEEILEDLTR